jgi:hypothetical protein
MPETLWESPTPSSAFAHGVALANLPRRECELAFWVEDGDDWSRRSLIFEAVVAYKCTHLPSLKPSMVKAAHDKVVSLKYSAWLRDSLPKARRFFRGQGRTTPQLRHLVVSFDQGPCYEFICEGFRAVASPA